MWRVQIKAINYGGRRCIGANVHAGGKQPNSSSFPRAAGSMPQGPCVFRRHRARGFPHRQRRRACVASLPPDDMKRACLECMGHGRPAGWLDGPIEWLDGTKGFVEMIDRCLKYYLGINHGARMFKPWK